MALYVVIGFGGGKLGGVVELGVEAVIVGVLLEWVWSLSNDHCEDIGFILSDWVRNGLLCLKEYDRRIGLYINKKRFEIILKKCCYNYETLAKVDTSEIRTPPPNIDTFCV